MDYRPQAVPQSSQQQLPGDHSGRYVSWQSSQVRPWNHPAHLQFPPAAGINISSLTSGHSPPAQPSMSLSQQPVYHIIQNHQPQVTAGMVRASPAGETLSAAEHYQYRTVHPNQPRSVPVHFVPQQQQQQQQLTGVPNMIPRFSYGAHPVPVSAPIYTLVPQHAHGTAAYVYGPSLNPGRMEPQPVYFSTNGNQPLTVRPSSGMYTVSGQPPRTTKVPMSVPPRQVPPSQEIGRFVGNPPMGAQQWKAPPLITPAPYHVHPKVPKEIGQQSQHQTGNEGTAKSMAREPDIQAAPAPPLLLHPSSTTAEDKNLVLGLTGAAKILASSFPNYPNLSKEEMSVLKEELERLRRRRDSNRQAARRYRARQKRTRDAFMLLSLQRNAAAPAGGEQKQGQSSANASIEFLRSLSLPERQSLNRGNNMPAKEQVLAAEPQDIESETSGSTSQEFPSPRPQDSMELQEETECDRSPNTPAQTQPQSQPLAHKMTPEQLQQEARREQWRRATAKYREKLMEQEHMETMRMQQVTQAMEAVTRENAELCKEIKQCHGLLEDCSRSNGCALQSMSEDASSTDSLKR